MAESAFPMRPTEVDPEREPRVVSLEDAGPMLEALSSRTGREVITVLEEEPMTPSALADRVDTSIQNALYHLDRLAAAELVEVVGTSFSERGNEMDVYAPAAAPVVICVGDETDEGDVAGLVEDGATTLGYAGSD